MRLWLRQNFGAAGWTVVIGLVFGVLVGLLFWLGSQPKFGHLLRAYDQLPREKRPWQLYLDWQPSCARCERIFSYGYSVVRLFGVVYGRPCST